MAEFSVKTNAVRTTVDAEEELKRELENIQQSIRKISGSLAIKTTAVPSLKRRLGRVAGRVEDHRESMGSMKNALEEAMGLYEKTEQNICGYTGGGIRAEAKIEEKGLSFWDWVANQIGKIVDGLHSFITTVWAELAAFWENIIGNGNVTDEQPTADWADQVVAGTAGEATGSAADGTVDGTTANSSSQLIADLKAREGTVVADINGENYYSNKNISYAGGYHNYKGVPQCTWYAYGRFMEVTGIALGSAHNAYTWLDYNVNDSRVKVTYGGENIQWPAVAVQPPNNYSSVGHVMFIEGVEYNADGTPAYVYLTEANNPKVKPDGTLQRLTYEEFKGRGVISGYISAA